MDVITRLTYSSFLNKRATKVSYEMRDFASTKEDKFDLRPSIVDRIKSFVDKILSFLYSSN